MLTAFFATFLSCTGLVAEGFLAVSLMAFATAFFFDVALPAVFAAEPSEELLLATFLPVALLLAVFFAAEIFFVVVFLDAVFLDVVFFVLVELDAVVFLATVLLLVGFLSSESVKSAFSTATILLAVFSSRPVTPFSRSGHDFFGPPPKHCLRGYVFSYWLPLLLSLTSVFRKDPEINSGAFYQKNA
ncbi:MAG: hypothetical protein AB8B64_07305 [Granulosicoccus sp.]